MWGIKSTKNLDGYECEGQLSFVFDEEIPDKCKECHWLIHNHCVPLGKPTGISNSYRRKDGKENEKEI